MPLQRAATTIMAKNLPPASPIDNICRQSERSNALFASVGNCSMKAFERFLHGQDRKVTSFFLADLFGKPTKREKET